MSVFHTFMLIFIFLFFVTCFGFFHALCKAISNGKNRQLEDEVQASELTRISKQKI